MPQIYFLHLVISKMSSLIIPHLKKKKTGVFILQDPLSQPPRPLTVLWWVLVATVLAFQGTRCTMMVAVVLRCGVEGPISATWINSS